MKQIISGQNNPLSQEEREELKVKAEEAYANFLTVLGYDLPNDPNMRDTPKRVAKMYVDEITSGSYSEPPKITVFENGGKYDEMVFSGGIEVKSVCSHHIVPFIGKCHIAYIPGPDSKIIGLSKLNRVVSWFAKRPQLQEQLTTQIHDYLSELLTGSLGIAVVIEAQHLCVVMRGVEQESVMKTSKLSGVFRDNSNQSRAEFYNFISTLKAKQTY